MRRTLIFAAALFAVSTAPAMAQGVRLKAVVHRAGSPTTLCRASVTAPLRFVYDPLSGGGEFATAVVTLTCTPPQILATISISAGKANQFLPSRAMWRNGSDSSHVLKYKFYTTSNYNVVWGDGTGGSSLEAINRTVTTFNAVIFEDFNIAKIGVAAGEYSTP